MSERQEREQDDIEGAMDESDTGQAIRLFKYKSENERDPENIRHVDQGCIPRVHERECEGCEHQRHSDPDGSLEPRLQYVAENDLLP